MITVRLDSKVVEAYFWVGERFISRIFVGDLPLAPSVLLIPD
jgi:hypothetical protein